MLIGTETVSYDETCTYDDSLFLFEERIALIIAKNENSLHSTKSYYLKNPYIELSSA